MIKDKKHIKMPKAIAKAWLKDLRANPKQGTGRLQDKKGGHCCLGRLQVVVDGDVERHEDGYSYGTPSLEWLEKNNIEFVDREDQKQRDPYSANWNMHFAKINDIKTPFSTIADLLKAEIEYND